MQQIDALKRGIRRICGELIVLVAPKTLSTLHLASFHKIPRVKEKKELLRLSRKMTKIITKFPLDSTQMNQKDNIDSNVKLFYEVYNKMEYLTLRELKSLYDFCSILKRLGYFNTIENNNLKEKIDSYNLYSENIDNFIESKKSKQKRIRKK